MTKDQIEQALDDTGSCMGASNCPFTTWEKEFIESVNQQYFENGGISAKQEQILQRIWDKV